MELLLKVFQRKAEDILNSNADFDAHKKELLELCGTLTRVIGNVEKLKTTDDGSEDAETLDCLQEHSDCINNPPEDPNFCDNQLWDCIQSGRKYQ